MSSLNAEVWCVCVCRARLLYICVWQGRGERIFFNFQKLTTVIIIIIPSVFIDCSVQETRLLSKDTVTLALSPVTAQV